MTQDRLIELYKQHIELQPNDTDGYLNFMDAVQEEFDWTEQEAYLATEFLFRPENMN